MNKSTSFEFGYNTTTTTKEAIPMGTKKASEKEVQGLQKRLNFWAAKHKTAKDEDKVDDIATAEQAMDRIQTEAQAKGIELAEPTTDAVAAEVPAAPAATGTASKSVQGKEKVAARAAAIAKDKAEGKGVTGAKKEPKPKKEKVLQPCLDGCGEKVGGNFKMGHDAKLKSLILKVERGVEGKEVIPDIAAGLVKFKKGEVRIEKDAKGNVKEKVQEYVCTAAPVKFQGRPDMELTRREAA